MGSQAQTAALGAPPTPTFKTKASGFFSRLARQPSSPQLHTIFSGRPGKPSPALHDPIVTTSYCPAQARTTPSTPSNLSAFPPAQLHPTWDPALASSVPVATTFAASPPTGSIPAAKPDPLLSPTLFTKLQRLNASRSQLDPPSPVEPTPTLITTALAEPAMPFDAGRAALPLFAGRPGAKHHPTSSATDRTTLDDAEGPVRRPKKMNSFWRFFNKQEGDGKAQGSPQSSPGSRHSRSHSATASPSKPIPTLMPTPPLPDIPSVITPVSDGPTSNRASQSGEDGTAAPATYPEVTSSVAYLETNPRANLSSRNSDEIALVDFLRSTGPNLRSPTKSSAVPPARAGSATPGLSPTNTPTPAREKALPPSPPATASTPAPTTELNDSPQPVLKKSVSTPSAIEAFVARDPVADEMDQRALGTARTLYHNEDSSLHPEEYVEYLGKRGPFYARVRAHYFNLFDFSGTTLEEAFRSLCAHVFIRGESQVIDRILIDFSRRYWQCNPNHPLLSDEDIVYAIVFSLLLLNTDLHVSQSDEKLSRTKFTELTLTTIDTCRQITARKREENPQPPQRSPAESSRSGPYDPSVLTSPILSPIMKDLNSSQPAITERATTELPASARSRLQIGPNTASSGKRFSFFDATGIGLPAAAFGSRSSTVVPPTGPLDGPAQHSALLALLKELYGSIKSQKLAQPSEALLLSRASLSSFRSGPLGVGGPGSGLTRSRSVSGLGPNPGSQRAPRLGVNRRGPLGAALDGTDAHRHGNSTQASPIAAVLTSSSGNLPFEGDPRPGFSVSSPRLASLRFNAASPTRSRAASVSSLSPSKKFNPFSASVVLSEEDDFGYQDGFAPSLNASLLMGGGGYSNDYAEVPVPNHMGYDERFVKSSVLVRKHLMERSDRKAANRSWKQCVVVLEHGMLNMYKAERGQADGSELTDPALQLGHVSLRHSLTNALPTPGYSRVRPFVFAIQLPHGGVYLFQTQTRDQLTEWVTSCNYWAARESKEPLVGGICNVDYGWVEPEDDEDDVATGADSASDTGGGSAAPPLVSTSARSPAMAALHYHSANSSTSLAVDSASDVKVASKSAESLSGSRGSSSSPSQAHLSSLPLPTIPVAAIHEWRSPATSLIRSNLDENAQLRALLKNITHLESQLNAHQDLRASIDRRFPPRTPTHTKAFSNWERKSQYLLRELIKYQTYADCLKSAIATRPGAAESARTTSLRNAKRLSRPPSFHQRPSLPVTSLEHAATVVAAAGSSSTNTSRSGSDPIMTIPLRTSSARLKGDTETSSGSATPVEMPPPTPVATPAVVITSPSPPSSAPRRAGDAMAEVVPPTGQDKYAAAEAPTSRSASPEPSTVTA
ncbi:hypothetical protein IWQ60_002523 [Tieghemiomyces parasiticus]|uniref:SEC7 domain-containing protein n=1 Tax=Tieghemiomyces parasiticus TaxID=78921 RepID=A0A9W8AC47_9FUNG|nr:hypothetical protein IWQ60_002523 [Tieghemiomyces parasiticus]